MKRLLTFFLVFLALTVFPAKRYWIGGGSTTGWNATPTTNWSATSGGTVRVAAPTSSDSVYFDGAGATGNSNSTINANYVVKMFTISAGYTATMNHSGYLSVAGDITLHSGYSTSGNVALQSTGAGIITTNGKVIKTPFNFITSAATRTINGNMQVDNIVTLGISNLVLNANTNETLTCNGGLSALAITTGTLKLILTSGQWGGGTSNALGLSVDIQGNISISSQGIAYGGSGTLTYVSGTVTQTTGSLYLYGTPTLDIDGVTWYNVVINTTSSTITLSATLTASSIQISATSVATVTFTGSYGFITDNFYIENIAALTLTLANNVTYEVSRAFSCYKSRVGAIVTLTSDHASNKAILYIHPGADCNILASFTRIDASSGRSLSTFNGTITDCLNISECHDCFGSTIGG